MDCLVLTKKIKAEQQDREEKVGTDAARLKTRQIQLFNALRVMSQSLLKKWTELKLLHQCIALACGISLAVLSNLCPAWYQLHHLFCLGLTI